MVHQNSPTVEVWKEKIEGNLRRAIRNRLWILGGPIQNRMCILGGPIRKPIRIRKLIRNLSKRVGKDGVFLGLAGLLLVISLKAALPALGKSRPSLLFYLD